VCGRILAEEKLGTRININRVEMAAATGTGLLLGNCPFCLTMFEDGVKGANKERGVSVRMFGGFCSGWKSCGFV